MASSLTTKTDASTSAIVGDLSANKAVLKPFEVKEGTYTTPEPKVATTVPAQSDSSDAKTFIYLKESGNNPASVNKSSGACGLGQALPCSKMPCSLSDYACQDAFFTKYMQSRYGTWENAKAFWLSHSWW